ncbi:TetR/AcrR family transcriptional regulator [Paraconexibacter antarcticus]|uniref:TetR/AcrR family transcriptional regulator n=1 Tax=Paraconexibacter antarcticus TaxID=2949664 RepID=A0ABY5DX42_9ACTN|nr:TetR/AcrR family transcriptional regulator [Paraconexibacter antarcticus]UTI66124.1 TetR/AcrR family transcriptional regulator [Paraconexibacter antarcticus]
MSAGNEQAPVDQGAIDEIGRDVVAAAREEFVRYGIRRANMEEIARRAGVARVTVYRRFDSKTTLVRAVVMADVLDFVERFDRVLFGDGPAAERFADATALSVMELRRHPLLTTVLRSDPETLLTALTVEGQPEFELIKHILATRITTLIEAGDIRPGEASRIAEFILRLLYTTILMPFGELPGKTEDESRAFAREFIVPLIINRPA